MISFEIPHPSHPYILHSATAFTFHQVFVSCMNPSFPILIRHTEKSSHFTQGLSALSISPRALISIFMFLHYFFPCSLVLSYNFVYAKSLTCQLLGKKMWFLLNSALWNERKHCINEAEELIHLCLYYCEINYAGLFRKLLIVANWMASISA